MPPASPAELPEPPGSPTPPPALPTAGWVVGSEGRAPVSGPDAAARRSARLDARLAVYAQHAAALAEEAAAACAGDLERADALGQRRSAAAEHFAELQGDVAPASAESPPPFDALLSEALLELEHQAAVDLALRQRLVALRDAMTRGATWASEAERPLSSASLLLPAPAADAEAGEETSPVGALEALEGLEGGLVAARADGVGRALGGQYPGLVTREEVASVLAAAERVGTPAAEGRAGSSGNPGRLDRTF